MNLTAKQVKKYKDKDFKTLHERAKYYFHRFIRLRDTDDSGYGFCISDGRPLRFGTRFCHAGHYFPAGNFRELEFNEDNVHVQSMVDNYYGHSCGASYTTNLMKKIGTERFEKLQMLSLISKRTTLKEDRFLMIQLIEKYKIKCKELESEKMFEL